MPASDEEVLQYILGITLGTKGWEEKTASMSRTLDQLNKKETANDAQAEATAKAFLGIQQQSTKQYETETNLQTKLLEAAKLRLVQEKLIQEQITTQAMQAKKLLEEHRQDSGHGTGEGGGAGGFLTPILNSLSGALGGGSAIGSVAMALGTGGATAAFLALGHAIGDVVGELDHFITRSGPLQQQLALFSTLSEKAGKNSKEWLEELKKATNGLVDDQTLVKDVNKILIQNNGLDPEKLTQLIDLSSKFAPVQGKDAAEGMEILSRAMLRGRYSMLGFQLGVDKATISELKRAEKLPAHIKMQEQMNILIKGMSNQLAQSGGPVDTYTEAMHRVAISTENTFEAIAAGITGGKGISVIIEAFNAWAHWLDEHEDMFKHFGSEAVQDVSLMVSAVEDLLGGLLRTLHTLAEPLEFTRGMGKSVTILSTLKTVLVGIAEIASLISYTFEDIASRITLTIDLAKAAFTEDTMDAAVTRFEKRQKEMVDRTEHELARLDNIRTSNSENPNPPKPPGDHGPLPDEDYDKKLEKLEDAARKAALELQTEQLTIELNKRREAYNKYYEEGKVSTKDWVDYNKDVNNQILELDLKKIRSAAATKRKAIDDAMPEPKNGEAVTPGMYTDLEALKSRQRAALDSETNLQITKAREATRQKNLSEDKKEHDEEIKLAKEYLDQHKKSLDSSFDDEKIHLDQVREMYDDFYDDGKMSLEDLVKYHKKINDELLKLELEKIESDKNIKLTNVDNSNTPRDERIQQRIQIEQDASASVDKVKETYRQKDRTEDKKLEADQEAALKANLDLQHKIRDDARKDEQAAVKRSFDRQEISADDYMASSRALIQQEKDDTVIAAVQKYLANKKSADAQVELTKAVVEANQKAREQNRQLNENESETYLKDLQDRYSRKKEILQSEQKDPALHDDATEQLVKDTQTYIDQLEELAKSDNAGAIGTPEFEALKKAIEAAKLELTGFKGEMKSLPDSLTGTMDVFGNFLSEHSKSGSWRAQALADVFKAAKQSNTAINEYGASTGTKIYNPKLNPLASDNLIAGIGQSFKDVFKSKSLEDFGKNMEKVNAVLKDSFQVISGGIQAFTTRGGIQGGLAGGSFGLGLGSAVDSLSKSLGPWGAVVGGVVGTVVGIFTGAARDKVDKMAADLTTSFTKVTEALSAGTTKLKDALAEEYRLRQKAIESLSTSKEGRAQLKSILPQMNQEIAQLQAQQNQTILQLKKDLAALAAPDQYNSAVTSIQGIIDKYKEYAGAVGTVQDAQDALSKAKEEMAKQDALVANSSFILKNIAKDSDAYKAAVEAVTAAQDQLTEATTNSGQAQDYLNLSVQQYIRQNQVELSSAETTAVQDAIALNDQLKQRQDLLTSTAQQEYDIMTQGVLVRQRSLAQTKGQQIADIQKAANLQLQQIDQQIALSQYKVDIEGQIFTLATTRINLETQLLVLQKQQTDADMKRIVALQVVTASLKSGASIDDINNLITRIGTLSQTTSMQDILNSNLALQARQGYAGSSSNF